MTDTPPDWQWPLNQGGEGGIDSFISDCVEAGGKVCSDWG